MDDFVIRMYREFLISKSKVWTTNNRFYIKGLFFESSKYKTIHCGCDICKTIEPYVVDRRSKKC